MDQEAKLDLFVSDFCRDFVAHWARQDTVVYPGIFAGKILRFVFATKADFLKAFAQHSKGRLRDGVVLEASLDVRTSFIPEKAVRRVLSEMDPGGGFVVVISSERPDDKPDLLYACGIKPMTWCI